MMNGVRQSQRPVTEADAYDKKKDPYKQVLCISMWRDGSGKAEVDGTSLPEFIRFIDSTPHGKKRVIKMLREAADLIEQGVL